MHNPFTRKVDDTYKRSLAKTLAWRFIAAIDTFAISYVITGKATWSVGIVGTEAVTKILWYYLHERLWSHITWGRSRWILPFFN